MRVIIVGELQAALPRRHVSEDWMKGRRSRFTNERGSSRTPTADCRSFDRRRLTDRNELSLQTPEVFGRRFRMDVRVQA